MKKILMCVSLSLMLLSGAFAADGTSWTYGFDWNSDLSWLNMTFPCEGGKAYIRSGSSVNQVINQNIPGLVLSGIYFEDDHYQRLSGKNISLVGNAEVGATFLKPDESPALRSPRIDLTLEGDGESTFTKIGKGTILLNQPLANFSAVTVAGGSLVSTNLSGTAFAVQDMTLDGGALAYLGQAAGTGSASSSMRGVTAGPGAEIHVRKVNASSASLTLGSLTRGTAGTLGLVTDATDALGSTERVLVSGKSTEAFCEPWCVGRETSGGQAIALLGYDAVNGFVKATSVTSLASASETDIVTLSSDETLTADKKVLSLVCYNGAQPTIPAGMTLTLGDAAGHVAALVMNGADAGNAEEVFENAGTIDFGECEGIVWRGAKRTTTGLADKRLTIRTRITGQNGVTFAGTGGALGTASKVLYQIGAGCAGWSGPTKIVGCTVHFERSTDFPGDVYVFGGDVNDVDGSASIIRILSPNASGETWSRHLYIRGKGALSIPAGKAYHLTYDAPVTLLGDTRLDLVTDLTRFTFNRPIDGRGDLAMADVKSTYDPTNTFAAVNTYRGKTTIGKNNTLVLSGEGTFGDGPVEFGEGSRLVVKHDYAITNAITGGAELEASGVAVGFMGGATFLSAAFDHAAVTVGADAAFGTFSCDAYTSITATNGHVTVSMGGDADTKALGKFTDGTGTLSLKKTGSGKLTLDALAGNAFSGDVSVENGTLAFAAEMPRLPGLAFWLDGADESTIGTQNGEVVSWRSKADGMLFRPEAQEGKTLSRPILAESMAGHALVTFTNTSNKVYCSLCGARETTQRTVFIVALPRVNNLMAGIFGKWGTDYGQRINEVNTTGGKWRVSGVTTATYDTRDGVLTLDGVDSTTGVYMNEQPQIMTMIHDRDKADNGADIPATFRVGLGWYCSNGGFNGSVAEAIGFDRVLSADERKAVEDYLANKWYGSYLHGGVKPATVSVPTGTALALDGAATLDLSGISATVSSLTGQGTITNSGDEPAVLTVTGECSFEGRLTGNVKLVKGGSASSGLRLDCEDTASLEVAGGADNTINAYPTPLPAEGLLYWLDAAKAGTVHTNADGTVTKWSSRAGSILEFTPSYLSNTQLGGGRYDIEVSAFGGKPGVHLGDLEGLRACEAAYARTVFLVFKPDYAANENPVVGAGVWGLDGNNIGIRYAYNATVSFGLGHASGSAYTRIGDIYRINGMQVADDVVVAAPKSETIVLSIRLGAFHTNVNYCVANALNAYAGKTLAGHNWFGEVLAYDRALSDAEFSAVENYLTAKWKGDGYIEPTGIFNDASTLSVKNGAGVAISGNQTVKLAGSTGGTVTAGYVELTDDVVLTMAVDGSVVPFCVNGLLDASRANLQVTGTANAKSGKKVSLVEATELVRPFASAEADHRRLKIVQTEHGYYGTTGGLTMVIR